MFFWCENRSTSSSRQHKFNVGVTDSNRMKKRNEIANGVDLMYHLFGQICADSLLKELVPQGDDIVVNLNSGPLEGRAVRLCPSKQGVSIEFHTHSGAALTLTHNEEAYVILQLRLCGTTVSDTVRGDLLEQAFSTTGRMGIMHMRSCKAGGIQYIIQFFQLISEFQGEYVFGKEVEESLLEPLGIETSESPPAATSGNWRETHETG